MHAELLAFLDQNQIPYQRFSHPPVFTCEEARQVAPDLPGADTKNLFLRDGKGKLLAQGTPAELVAASGCATLAEAFLKMTRSGQAVEPA